MAKIIPCGGAMRRQEGQTTLLSLEQKIEEETMVYSLFIFLFHSG